MMFTSLYKFMRFLSIFSLSKITERSTVLPVRAASRTHITRNTGWKHRATKALKH